MAVEVVTPEDYMGDVMGDCQQPPWQASAAWSSAATPRSSGRGAPVGDVRLRHRPAFAHPGSRHYTMQFDSYQQMPSNVQEEIVARVRGE
jgi:elongation factor G